MNFKEKRFEWMGRQITSHLEQITSWLKMGYEFTDEQKELLAKIVQLVGTCS